LIGTTGLNQLQLSAEAPYVCAPCYKRRCHFEESGAAMSSCMNAFTPTMAWGKLKIAMAQQQSVAGTG